MFFYIPTLICTYVQYSYCLCKHLYYLPASLNQFFLSFLNYYFLVLQQSFYLFRKIYSSIKKTQFQNFFSRKLIYAVCSKVIAKFDFLRKCLLIHAYPFCTVNFIFVLVSTPVEKIGIQGFFDIFFKYLPYFDRFINSSKFYFWDRWQLFRKSQNCKGFYLL